MMDMDTVAGMRSQSLEFTALEILFRCRSFIPAMWRTMSGMIVKNQVTTALYKYIGQST